MYSSSKDVYGWTAVYGCITLNACPFLQNTCLKLQCTCMPGAGYLCRWTGVVDFDEGTLTSGEPTRITDLMATEYMQFYWRSLGRNAEGFSEHFPLVGFGVRALTVRGPHALFVSLRSEKVLRSESPRSAAERKFACACMYAQAALLKRMIDKVLSLCYAMGLTPAATIQDGCSAHRKEHVEHCTLALPANTLSLPQDFKCGFVDCNTLKPVWVISDMPHTLIKKPRNGWLSSRKAEGSSARRWVKKGSDGVPRLIVWDQLLVMHAIDKEDGCVTRCPRAALLLPRNQENQFVAPSTSPHPPHNLRPTAR